ncbi:Ca-activated chloride channel family protein [Mesonia phycicola]|uniref:Ca-activated chloride channel family protein n=1 Tax=Mesonia phycicola TaxID=579105 RepID=A0A1M6CUB7_9FLAO|nr:VWA domain-containing protein [Mesonia phycicola]SHI64617.1 Ca-activated chloride channel family protein [Mesonia phycicola]
MVVLEEKIYFWFLLAILVVVLVFFLQLYWKKKAQRKFASIEALEKLSPNKSKYKPALKVLFWSLGIACLVMALVNPKIGSKMETIKREGVDIVFAIDVSKSMLAEDIAPNRLEKSKQLVTQIINNLTSDRVGIVAYAGSAFPQLPITTDYGSAKLFLQAMNTDMVSSQGTAINEAIELAQTYYNDETETSRILFLISDGEDHGGNINDIAAQAAEKGIRIYTIGVGTPKGGPIPIKRNNVIQSYKKDRAGETVITRLDQSTLEEISSATNGEFITGSNTKAVVDKVKDILANIEKTEFESTQFADYKDQFQWFLGFGILFILLDVLVLERKTAWIRSLNLFNEKKEDEA